MRTMMSLFCFSNLIVNQCGWYTEYLHYNWWPHPFHVIATKHTKIVLLDKRKRLLPAHTVSAEKFTITSRTAVLELLGIARQKTYKKKYKLCTSKLNLWQNVGFTPT